MDRVMVSLVPTCPEATAAVRAPLPLPPKETEIRYPRYQRSRNFSPACECEGEECGCEGSMIVGVRGESVSMIVGVRRESVGVRGDSVGVRGRVWV